MSDRKHTPGPWFAEGDEIDGLWVTPEDRDASVICHIVGRSYDTEKNEQVYTDEDYANADLIAAAPDLLALAERIEAWEARLVLEGEWGDGLPRFTQSLYDEWMQLQALRNAAIAKAKGEEADE